MSAGVQGAVLVVGATSGAGKSTVVAGLGRLLARRGVAVAPFKAQNMSNHSAVTEDGGEIGRAQAMQAAACGVAPSRAMNPILLKPGGRAMSHVVVDGAPAGRTDARDWGPSTATLKPRVLDALRSLRHDVDVVVAEGAGGAAEINLFDRDLVNLPLAAAAGIPAVLVVDIDRGGAFAAAHGTIDLLPDELRAPLAGIVFNRFRGDASLLTSGIAELEARHGLPVLGVLSHLGEEPLFGVEDSLDLGSTPLAEGGSVDPLRVGVIALPHLSNPSDFDPLVAEPDVAVTWVQRPGQLVGLDLVIVPGSRATVDDLAWLHRVGLAEAIVAGDADVIGICAGAQMLGTEIRDDVESPDPSTVTGLGLTPAVTVFRPAKVVRQIEGRVADGGGLHGLAVGGYQIHHGHVTGGDAWLELDDGTSDGAVAPRPGRGHGPRSRTGAGGARVRTTTVHGLFDADAFRGRLLEELALRNDRSVKPSPIPFADRLAAQHDRLADWLETHLDVDATIEVITTAAPTGHEPGWR